ncbi:MAG TPA: hypothetical protein VGX96_12120 [Candidatus Elarobacter sp.]|jgi:hypothetical protein|nr:hypothetical protein [Candidatus Elarobacter sp.]
MLSFSFAARGCAAFALAVTMLATPASQALAAPVAAPIAPQLEPFRWLVGGAWRADTSALPGGLKYIETRYDLAPNGSTIRFTTKFVGADGNPQRNGYAGNLYFDATAKHAAMWYIDTDSAITQGPITVAGDLWSMTFTSDGAIVGRPGPTSFRVDVARRSNDAYKWTLFWLGSETPKQLFSLDYVRSTG